MITSMLTGEDKDKILQLRAKGFSYEKIHERTGFSKDTIMKECQNEKERKLKERTKDQTPGKGVHSTSLKDGIQGIIVGIDNLIENKELKVEEEIKWENRREELREMLRIEVDEKISREVEKAVNKRDIEWDKNVKQAYVPKEEAKAKDATIVSLRNAIKEKDGLIEESQQEIKDLKVQRWNLQTENNDLRAKNTQLNSYIDNRFNNEIRQRQDQLNQERIDITNEKKEFANHVRKKKTELHEMFREADKILRRAEAQEIELDARDKNLKQREKDLDAKRTKFYNDREESIQGLKQCTEKLVKADDELKRQVRKEMEQITCKKNALNKTAEEQKIEEQRLKRWQTKLEKTGGFNKFFIPCNVCKKAVLIDVTTPKIRQKLNEIFRNYKHPECIKKETQTPSIILRVVSDIQITKRPAPLSGQPILRSGFSPMIQAGAGAIADGANDQFVIQSGCSPITRSRAGAFFARSSGQPIISSSCLPIAKPWKETRVIQSSGEPFTVSGYSPRQ